MLEWELCLLKFPKNWNNFKDYKVPKNSQVYIKSVNSFDVISLVALTSIVIFVARC